MNQSPLLDAAAALSTVMDFAKGRMAVCTRVHRMKIGDMKDFFTDEEAQQEASGKGNATVYEVHMTEPADGNSHSALCYSSVIVYPGRVGEEYYMTRGHAHPSPEGTEVYLTIGGQGMMLLQTQQNQVQALSMSEGTVLYVPGTAYHRVVNIGDEPLIVFTVYPMTNAHGQLLAHRHTFRRIIKASKDGPDLAVNPAYSEAAVAPATDG